MADHMKISKTRTRDYPDLPQRIAEARKQCQKPVSAICGEAGVSATFFYQILAGNAPGMTLETLQALERALGADFGITESDLMGEG